MKSKDNKDAIESMQALHDRLRRKLEQSEDYRVLKALEEAIAKVSDGKRGVVITSPSLRRPSQGEAAYIAIKTEGKPLSISELLERLAAAGVTVGGANPKINLSSTLSRDERVESVHWGGASRWWLHGAKLPEDPGEYGFG